MNTENITELRRWQATFSQGDATWTQSFDAKGRQDARQKASDFCYETSTRFTVKEIGPAAHDGTA